MSKATVSVLDQLHRVLSERLVGETCPSEFQTRHPEHPEMMNSAIAEMEIDLGQSAFRCVALDGRLDKLCEDVWCEQPNLHGLAATQKLEEFGQCRRTVHNLHRGSIWLETRWT